LWYKLQPYLIALLTAPGIPLLFQGQEFGENYTLPLQGIGRTLLLRPVRWDYFYDTAGQYLVHLVRALLQIRRSLPQFRTGSQYFYNDAAYAAQHLVLFSRGTGSQFSLVAVNLSDTDALTSFTFPQAGLYHELNHARILTVLTAGSSPGYLAGSLIPCTAGLVLEPAASSPWS